MPSRVVDADGLVHVTVSGPPSAARFRSLMHRVLAECAARDIATIPLPTLQLGLPNSPADPSDPDDETLLVAGSPIKLAIVTSPEQLEGYFVTVPRTRTGGVREFADEIPAVVWLLGPYD